MTTQDYIRERLIEITDTEVFGFLFAMKGMRLSYDKKSDSVEMANPNDRSGLTFCIGDNDKKRVKSLITKDDSECKFLRQIKVQCFIKAPRYWWIEFDTYKVGVTCQSESTMHTLKRTINKFI